MASSQALTASLRLASGTLLRHRWRTALTVLGIAVALALLVFFDGFMAAMFDRMVTSSTAIDIGDARIERLAHVDDASLYHAMNQADAVVAAAAAVPGVASAAPRVQAFGLLGQEQRSQVVSLVGVDAAAERETSALADAMIEGAWLSAAPEDPPAPREVVLGRGLAELLRVDVGAELVVVLNGADGSLGDDLLVVKGVLATGNSQMDRMAAFMHLGDLQYLTVLEGRAHTVLVRYEPTADVDATTLALGEAIAAVPGTVPDGAMVGEGDAATADALSARSWRQVSPELAQMLDLSAGQRVFLYLIILGIAALGLFNTQRMSAMERRREFGVQMAVGLTPRRLVLQILWEALIVTALAGLVGIGLGAGINAYFASVGFDMGVMADDSGQPMRFMGVDFSDPILFQWDPAAFVTPMVAVLALGLVCGLWPAFKASRLDPVRAIAGRT